jgi:post-segregation antitoxin (ccd killing protein)
LFAPERGVENPIIRRAIGLCEEAGMKVIYHEDTVEVWFAPNNKRFYTIWSQFLADAEAIFGDRMVAPPPAEPPARNGFGSRGVTAVAEAPSAHADAAGDDELKKLRGEIKLLERAIRVVGMQRDEWKKEADRLTEELAETRTEVAQLIEARGAFSSSGPDRYKAVRQIIVRRLHPDVPGTDEEKSYREKLFKTIWKEIEVLDKK